MASTEDSRRASIASSSEMSFADSTTGGKAAPKRDKSANSGAVKLKKSIAKKTKPKDTESNGTKTGGNTRSPSPTSPNISSTPSKQDNQPPGTSPCPHCKKNIANKELSGHMGPCLERKKALAKRKKESKEARMRAAKEAEEKANEKDADSTAGDKSQTNGTGSSKTGNGDTSSSKKPPTKKSAPKADDSNKKIKKRKADEPNEDDKEPKKKKQKKDTAANNTAATTTGGTPQADAAPKPKATKPKGPVNVELQCGVPLPNGGFCARSLTCKSHSMGSKRAVPGRSAPYDQLLQQYQKKNQAKQQKALLATQAAQAAAEAGEAGEGEEGNAVDSDEERDGVMKGISRGWGGRPLEKVVVVPTLRRYRGVRIREMVQGALAGGRLFAGSGLNATGSTTAAGGAGVPSTIQASPITGDPMDTDGGGVRRGSMVGSSAANAAAAAIGKSISSAGAASAATNAPMRKASVASVGA